MSCANALMCVQTQAAAFDISFCLLCLSKHEQLHQKKLLLLKLEQISCSAAKTKG